jgi:hypothetical protein
VTAAELNLTLMRLEQKLDRLLTQTGPKQPSDDGKVFKLPSAKYWNGSDFTGSKFSECSAEFLRAFAKYKGACAWANRKEGDPKKADYAVKDDAAAKLAIAWAEYKEASGEAPAPPTEREPGSDDVSW